MRHKNLLTQSQVWTYYIPMVVLMCYCLFLFFLTKYIIGIHHRLTMNACCVRAFSFSQGHETEWHFFLHETYLHYSTRNLYILCSWFLPYVCIDTSQNFMLPPIIFYPSMLSKLIFINTGCPE